MTQAQVLEYAPLFFSIAAGLVVFALVLSIAGWFLDYIEKNK